MTRSEENRYPHSADLFRFCKEALNIKHNFEVKVIDQHVGAILGYDPADCCHWKKGRKNIRSLQTLGAIAKHLEVDPRFVMELVSGQVDLEESIQEYKGYGAFQVSERQCEDLKRDYIRNLNQQNRGSADNNKTFEQSIDLQREQSQVLVKELLHSAQVTSMPVLIPELISVLQDKIQIIAGEPSNQRLVQAGFSQHNNKYVVTYREGEMRPHIRFLIAREIGRVLLNQHNITGQGFDEVVNARINLFASLLLVPNALLIKVTNQLDPTRDFIQQLSEYFWVSRFLITSRLKDFFIHGN